MTQTTAPAFDSVIAQAGQLVDMTDHDVDSFAAEETIPFGRAMKRGTDPEKQVLIVDGSGDTFLGVSMLQHTVENPFPSGEAQFAIGDTVSVMTEGRVYVEVTDPVIAGAAAFVDVANGKFTDVSSGNLAVPGGTFLTSAADNGIAALKF